MKRTVNRIVFWLLLAIFAAGSIWWTLAIPHNPEQLMRAIPGHAVSVTMHDKLAIRWNDISAHPLAAPLVGIFGGDPEEIPELKTDAGFQYILQLVGRQELVLAYVPYMGPFQENAWVFASWIGGKSQRLRWSYPFLKLKDLRRLNDVGGWPVWTYVWSTSNDTHRLTFSLVEGMMIGTMARDPRAIEVMIESYNGSFPSIASRKDLNAWKQELLRSGYADRILYKQQGWPESRMWFVEANLAHTSRLSGVVRTTGQAPASPVAASFDLRQLAALWGNHPITASAMDVAAMKQFVREENQSVPAVIFRDVLRVTDARSVAAGLFGGEFSGRFKGIRIPTLMLGFQMANENQVTEGMKALIDRWNADFQWGLVPVETKIGGRTVWRLEGTSENIYSALVPAEQAAVMTEGNWLIVSSNLKGMETLILSNAPATGADQKPAPWVISEWIWCAAARRSGWRLQLIRLNCCLKMRADPGNSGRNYKMPRHGWTYWPNSIIFIFMPHRKRSIIKLNLKPDRKFEGE